MKAKATKVRVETKVVEVWTEYDGGMDCGKDDKLEKLGDTCGGRRTGGGCMLWGKQTRDHSFNFKSEAKAKDFVKKARNIKGVRAHITKDEDYF